MGNKELCPAQVKLAFEPIWSYVSCVRSFVSHFFSVGLQDKRDADNISLAVSELLENAVKYSSDSRIEIELKIIANDGENKKIAVSVANKTTKVHVERLTSVIEKANGSDPEETYLRAMREAADKPSGEAGLGLIRIRLISKCNLEFSKKSNDVVEVKLSFTVTG